MIIFAFVVAMTLSFYIIHANNDGIVWFIYHWSVTIISIFDLKLSVLGATDQAATIISMSEDNTFKDNPADNINAGDKISKNQCHIDNEGEKICQNLLVQDAHICIGFQQVFHVNVLLSTNRFSCRLIGGNRGKSPIDQHEVDGLMVHFVMWTEMNIIKWSSWLWLTAVIKNLPLEGRQVLVEPVAWPLP